MYLNLGPPAPQKSVIHTSSINNWVKFKPSELGESDSTLKLCGFSKLEIVASNPRIMGCIE